MKNAWNGIEEKKTSTKEKQYLDENKRHPETRMKQMQT